MHSIEWLRTAGFLDEKHVEHSADKVTQRPMLEQGFSAEPEYEGILKQAERSLLCSTDNSDFPETSAQEVIPLATRAHTLITPAGINTAANVGVPACRLAGSSRNTEKKARGGGRMALLTACQDVPRTTCGVVHFRSLTLSRASRTTSPSEKSICLQGTSKWHIRVIRIFRISDQLSTDDVACSFSGDVSMLGHSLHAQRHEQKELVWS